MPSSWFRHFSNAFSSSFLMSDSLRTNFSASISLARIVFVSLIMRLKSSTETNAGLMSGCCGGSEAMVLSSTGSNGSSGMGSNTGSGRSSNGLYDSSSGNSAGSGARIGSISPRRTGAMSGGAGGGGSGMSVFFFRNGNIAIRIPHDVIYIYP